MNRERQLQWVMRNRARGERARLVSSVLEEVLNTADTREGDAAREVAARLGKLVDDEFREHCRVAAVTGRTVSIQVDDAALVSVIRLRWSTILGRTLARGRGQLRVSKLLFEHGREGAIIGHSG